jgi:hypothetical protein
MQVGEKFLNELFQSPLIPVFMFLALGSILLGVILRVACKKLKYIPQSASACFGIIFIYICAISLFGIKEGHSNVILEALPFFEVISDYGSIFELMHTDFNIFFNEVIRMFFLAFTVNFLQDITRCASRKFLMWYFFECVVVFAAMLINFAITYAAQKYLPQNLIIWTPKLVFILLGILLLLLLLKTIFKTALFFANPIFTGIFSFLTGTLIGKTLTKSFITTVGLSAVVVIIDRLGFSLMGLSAVGISAFAPVIILLLLLWFMVHKLLC